MNARGLAAAGLVRALVLAVAAALASAGAWQAGPGVDQELTRHMLQARAAAARCDWEAAVGHAQRALASAAEGSDAWIEAGAHLVRGDYERWETGEPDEILSLARKVAALAHDREYGGPLGLQTQFGQLPSIVRGHFYGLLINAARVLQARGEHEGALFYLREVLDLVAYGPVPDPNALKAKAALDAGLSLSALGRGKQARDLLESLRDGFGAYIESGVAAVLLQQGPEGFAAYRGRYQGDERLAARAQELARVLPRARGRLVQAFGCDEALLARVAVGIADAVAAAGPSIAITLGDPRRGEFAPVVVVFSQHLVQQLCDLETLLTHELCHAWLIQKLGTRYERLPGWTIEGVPQAASGEWPSLADALVARQILQEAPAFLRAGYWTWQPVDFLGPPCGGAGDPAAGLALWLLEDPPQARRVERFVEHLLHGEDPYRAYELLAGSPPEGLLEWIRPQVNSRLERIRQSALSAVASVQDARVQGNEAVLARAEEALSSRERVVRGFALWERAQALERLGQFPEAIGAYDELLAAPSELLLHQEGARVGSIRCLLALGRRDEARRELATLARDSVILDVAAWAGERLAELERDGPERR